MWREGKGVASWFAIDCSQEVLDGGTLREKLVSCDLDGGLGCLIIEIETHNWGVLARGGRAWEREHDALRNVVESSIGLEADGLPLIRSENPVAHVVNRGVAS